MSQQFAAIDIGTNAVRLLFYNIYLDMDDRPVFKKIALTRVPIRLGEDVFTHNRISEEKVKLLAKTLQAFKNLIEVYNVLDYKACATSAMREAENGADVIRQLREETGIQIELIDGATEADLIYANHIAERMSDNRAYLYVDVGGGSTELTLFYKGKKRYAESFDMGTVRMLHKKVSDKEWERVRLKCVELNALYKNILAIGSGGNIIKLHRLSGAKEDEPFSRQDLKEVYQFLKAHSYEERMRLFGLNPDRADVILPAAEIFLHICKNADIKSIIVPKIGLSDGIIHSLYEKHLQLDREFLRK